MLEYDDVPSSILEHMRSICLGLPETYEEPAWIGVRWRIRKRTFTHLYTVYPDQETASPGVARLDGPTTLMTFRAAGAEFLTLTSMGFPFWRAGWGTDVVSMAFTPTVDWAEVAELLTDSYRILAPRKLARMLVAGDE